MRTILTTTLALTMIALPVWAHPRLTAAGPVPGSVIKTAPKTIRIQFSESIELSFSGVTLKNARGEVIQTGEATLSPGSKTLLMVPIAGALEPGKYTVEWRALGDDTHPQKGQFAFELKP